MTGKLTLSLDADVVEFARVFSEKHNKPVSKIIEDYFVMLKETRPVELPADLGELYGIFEGMDAPDKKTLRTMFNEKHCD